MTDFYIGDGASFIGEAEVGSPADAPAAPPFTPIDWGSIRRGRVRASVDYVPNLLTTTLAPAATYQRGPLFVNSAKAHPRAVDPVQNLLATTLAAQPAAAPFLPAEPILSRARSKREVANPPNLLTSTLTPVEYEAFQALEDLYPRRRGRGFIEVPPNLLLTTLGQPAADPFRPVEPEVARRRAGRDLAQVPNLLTTTLASPFAPAELPARAPRGRREVDVFQNLLGSTLAQQQAAPFVPVEFPAARRRGHADFEWAQNFLPLRTPPTGTPFVPPELVAHRAAAARYADYVPNLLSTTLAPEEPVAPSTSPWIVHRGRRRGRR